MNSSNPLSFKLNLALLVVMILLVSTVSSLALVHMRVEIEQTATRMRQKERKVAEMEREDRFLDARIAHVHQPRELMGLMTQHSLDLQPIHPTQVVHVRSTMDLDGGYLAEQGVGSQEGHQAADPAFALNIAVLQQQPSTRRSAP